MHVKGHGGYVGTDGVPRLNVLDVQKQIRSIPKPVIAMVNGYAIGGGHVLHVVCDLTIASENAIFGQTGPRVGSFDAGFGSSYLARIVGQKKAREIWFLCRQYSAQEALDMGLVNKVVPFDQLEDEVVEWAETMMQHSPLALRMIKAGLNAELDGQAGIQELAGDATMLYYMTEEAQEGGKAFLEKRKPDWSKYLNSPDYSLISLFHRTESRNHFRFLSAFIPFTTDLYVHTENHSAHTSFQTTGRHLTRGISHPAGMVSATY